MADAYIHSTGSGTSPYDTWAKAANNATQAQAVLDAAVAGETIHAAGTITLAAQLNIDMNEGSIAAGFIKIVGYNASHVNDGTRFILDGNNAAVNILNNASMNYWWFENIECKNTNGGDGWEGSGPVYYNVFVNCCANNCDAYGFATYDYTSCLWIRCVAYSNTGNGFGTGRGGQHHLFCRSRNNGGSGFVGQYGSGVSYVGCIADHNTNDGFDQLYLGAILFNCVSDDNSDDGIVIRSTTNICAIIGSRVTNHDDVGDIGVNVSSRCLVHGWNYYQNNDGANIQNGTLTEEILYGGSGTDAEDQGDTESGYVDQDDPEDYNLTDAATSRRTGIQIPLS